MSVCCRVLERVWDDPFAVSFIEPVDCEMYDDYLGTCCAVMDMMQLLMTQFLHCLSICLYGAIVNSCHSGVC